jgi:hypothetical protein
LKAKKMIFYQMQRDGSLHEHLAQHRKLLRFEQCQSCHDFCILADGRRHKGKTVRCGLPSKFYCRRSNLCTSVAIF